jgi:hypothetical protein
MAETHEVRVVAKKGYSLTIDLFIVIPEITEWCTARSYLLQVLWDRMPENGKPSALHQAISTKNRLDQKWLANNKDTFIASVVLLRDANFPAESVAAFIGRDRQKLPRATYEIEVTDRKWIQHISSRDKWDSVPLDIEGF